MSGVATLEARGAKRVFEEMCVDVPTTCAPSRFLRPPLKRTRCGSPGRSYNRFSVIDAHIARSTKDTGATSSSASVSSSASSSQIAGAPSSSTNANNNNISTNSQSPTIAPPRLSAEEVAALARHVPKRLKRVVERVASGDVSPGEKLFTVEDVREIVTSVVAEREERMKTEFENELNDCLAEQFRVFTKFNEDYISRELRGTDVTYLS